MKLSTNPWILTSTAFLLSIVVNFLMIRKSRKNGWFLDPHDAHKPQRFHKTPTPRAGGIGIMAGLLPLFAFPWGWRLFFPALAALFSGLFEDFRRDLSPRKRLFLQLFAALVALWLSGTVVDYLGFGIHLPYVIALAFSAFAIVGAMNAFNIIDGFNGLAGGTALMILLAFTFTAHEVQLHKLEMVLWMIIASLAGFLLFNFPRGLIFLGDGGAYLLGFLVAITGITLAGSREDVSPWYILAAMIYPVWEVLFSILRKRAEGRSPLQPDPYHLHMLVYRHITKSNPGTSILLLAANLPFLLLATVYHHNSKANFGIVLLYILSYTLFYHLLRREESR